MPKSMTPSIAKPASSGSSARGMLPIPVATLRPLECLSFELYLPGDPAVLFKGRNLALNQADIQGLQSTGVELLYTTAAGSEAYQQYLDSNIDELIADESKAPKERYEIMQLWASAVLSSSMQAISTDTSLAQCRRVGEQISTLIIGREMLAGDLYEVMRHDYYTYTHLLNVATYCVVLAERLGIRDADQLNRIAVGALLHDFGKRNIPPAILNKKTILNPTEKDLVRQHPRTGFEEICHREDLDWDQLMMVYQHHERNDGAGYPVRLPRREIHWSARLCAVVDVFDAMTCARPYRKALTMQAALDYLDEQATMKLDKDMVRCWIQATQQNN